MLELFPFTNFHDLNLDWIIRTVKTYAKKVDDLYNFGLYDFVEKVLEAHPEWTTTVMDGAISKEKLSDALSDRLFDGVEIIPTATTGSGDGVLLITPSGHVTLSDTNSSTDVGTIVSVLTSKGITHIDALIISHYHNDHVGGLNSGALAAYLDSDTIAYLPFNVPAGDSDLTTEYTSMQTAKTTLQTYGCQIEYPADGDAYPLDNDTDGELTFWNINNGSTYLTLSNKNYNNCSMVTVYRFGHSTCLLTGDIAQEAQAYCAGVVGKNTVMKAQHHGSDNFINTDFINTVNPDLIFITASSVNENTWLLSRQFITQTIARGWPSYSTTSNSTFSIWMDGYGVATTRATALDTTQTITSLDMLMEAEDYGQVFSGVTLQDIADQIPYNTQVDVLFNLDRVPDLFTGFDTTFSATTGINIRCFKNYNNYYFMDIISVTDMKNSIAIVRNGTVEQRIRPDWDLGYEKVSITLAAGNPGRTHRLPLSTDKDAIAATIEYNNDLYYLTINDGVTPITTVRTDGEVELLLLGTLNLGAARTINFRVITR